jgi:hypothetical protein
MDRAEKLDLIARFELAVDPLIELVQTAPAAAVDFRPDLPGAWTVREHAAHFLDAEAFAHSRMRTAVAEPGTHVQVWDEEAWQAKAHYDLVDPQGALEIARSLRNVTSAMALALVDSDWNAYHVQHAKRGRMTLADLLRFYVDHAQAHAQYLQRNLAAYQVRPG